MYLLGNSGGFMQVVLYECFGCSQELQAVCICSQQQSARQNTLYEGNCTVCINDC